jgi:hypothetical protein
VAQTRGWQSCETGVSAKYLALRWFYSKLCPVHQAMNEGCQLLENAAQAVGFEH